MGTSIRLEPGGCPAPWQPPPPPSICCAHWAPPDTSPQPTPPGQHSPVALSCHPMQGQEGNAMDYVPQLSALSHPPAPPTRGPAVGGCCSKGASQQGKTVRGAVGGPSFRTPFRAAQECERMVGPPAWWWHQGVLAFSGGDQRAAMGAEAGEALRAAASGHRGAFPGPAEELLPAAAPSLPGGADIPASPCPRAKSWCQWAAGSQASLPPASFS